MKLEQITSVITDYVANGSFASLRENAKYVSKEDGYARVIRLTDENCDYKIDNSIYVTKDSYEFLSKSKLKSGDIIVSNVGAYLGTVFQCPNLNIPMTLGPNAILIKPNDTVLNKYLYYLLFSDYGHHKLTSLVSGSAMPKFNKTDLKKMDLSIHSLLEQQHIVDTIGSVDNSIENLELQIRKLKEIGQLKINGVNASTELNLLSKICKFEKGIELGSANYIEDFSDGLVHYLRVGDLLSLTNTYVETSLCKNVAVENDILIAFDGAPGRNEVGLNGAFSSGIYKVISDEMNKGLIYFELNSIHNQKIISDHAQGTTILHASKAIQYLECIDATIDETQYFKSLFDQIILLKKKINHLKTIKQTLLDKYFTNQ